MRFVKLSEDDIKGMATSYQNLIAEAWELLFFLWGKEIGKEIWGHISEKEEPLKRAADLIEGRGWAEKILLEEEMVIAKDCIETHKSYDSPSCHILRGIISAIHEKSTRKLIEVEEVKCESLGDEHCEFKIKRKEL